MGGFLTAFNNPIVMTLLDGKPGATDAKNDLDIFMFMQNIANYIGDIGQWVIVIAGVVLLLVGAIQIVKGLASGGKGQVNWVMSIGCLLVGGIMVAGGFTMIAKLSAVGNQTAETMATTEYETKYKVFDGTATGTSGGTGGTTGEG